MFVYLCYPFPSRSPNRPTQNIYIYIYIYMVYFVKSFFPKAWLGPNLHFAQYTSSISFIVNSNASHNYIFLDICLTQFCEKVSIRTPRGKLSLRKCVFSRVYSQRVFFSQTVTLLTNVVFSCLLSICFSAKKLFFWKTSIVLILYMPAGVFSLSKKYVFWKTSIVLMWYMPAGAFLPKKYGVLNVTRDLR